MRALDPRLVRRAGAVRALLAVDVVLGVIAALLVLVQAVLIATVAARAFDGAPLDELTVPLALLVAASIGRAAAASGFEVVGRRAATDVLATLRLELVERRLRDQPAALDGAESAEVATAAVAGVDALETTFARYLPQVVLAVTIPVAVLVFVAVVDPVSAGVMLLTLPLVPVFMWLVGRYTEQRARERWQTLALLATHFLDVVRGLPTLRAFNRGEAQTEQIGAVSEQYRRTTMATLRVAFLSGTVLELAATLGIALVAVTVGVRLVEGGIGFEAGLTVLVLAPELYLPLRNLAAQFHASADGLAVSQRLLDLVDVEVARREGTLSAPSPRSAPVRLEGVSFAYPTRPALVLDQVDLELRPGETVALVGPSGGGKSTIASLLLRLAEPAAGASRRERSIWPSARRRRGARRSRGCRSSRRSFAAASPTTSGSGCPPPPTGPCRPRRPVPARTSSCAPCRDGYDTVVGEGGRPLSAGEVQRIALARAFLRDAALVILDEPTANLDPASAELVSDAIERLRAGRTVLLIVHRPELAARADRVVRLHEGRVVETVAAAA